MTKRTQAAYPLGESWNLITHVGHPHSAARDIRGAIIFPYMNEVRIGVIGLGNVGSGTLAILAETADQIALKLGFRLTVSAVCSRGIASLQIPEALGPVFRTPDRRQVADHPDGDIVAELDGATTTAAARIHAAIAGKKPVRTATKAP